MGAPASNVVITAASEEHPSRRGVEGCLTAVIIRTRARRAVMVSRVRRMSPKVPQVKALNGTRISPLRCGGLKTKDRVPTFRWVIRYTFADAHHRIPFSAFAAAESGGDHRRRSCRVECGLRAGKRRRSLDSAGGEQGSWGHLPNGRV